MPARKPSENFLVFAPSGRQYDTYRVLHMSAEEVRNDSIYLMSPNREEFLRKAKPGDFLKSAMPTGSPKVPLGTAFVLCLGTDYATLPVKKKPRARRNIIPALKERTQDRAYSKALAYPWS